MLDYSFFTCLAMSRATTTYALNMNPIRASKMSSTDRRRSIMAGQEMRRGRIKENKREKKFRDPDDRGRLHQDKMSSRFSSSSLSFFLFLLLLPRPNSFLSAIRSYHSCCFRNIGRRDFAENPFFRCINFVFIFRIL